MFHVKTEGIVVSATRYRRRPAHATVPDARNSIPAPTIPDEPASLGPAGPTAAGTDLGRGVDKSGRSRVGYVVGGHVTAQHLCRDGTGVWETGAIRVTGDEVTALRSGSTNAPARARRNRETAPNGRIWGLPTTEMRT